MIELPQFFWRQFDELGVGIVMGLPMTEEGLANAFVDCVDR